jgi:hypothetical protein
MKRVGNLWDGMHALTGVLEPIFERSFIPEIGHARHANTYGLRADLFARIPFQRAAANPSPRPGRDVQQPTGERPLGEP